MSERPYQPFYKPYSMSDEEYAYECNLASERLQQWELEQSEQQMIEEEMQKEIKQLEGKRNERN